MTSTVKNSDIPSWMVPIPEEPSEPTPTPAIHPDDIGKSNAQLRRELLEMRFSNFFETVLTKLEQGINLRDILREDVRDFDDGQFRRWIHKDPQRKARYYEAQEIGSEMIAADLLNIADGDGMEDVQRSKLRIEARQFLLRVWNRKRFGDVKTLEVNQSISITAALEQANQRLVSGITIEHEDID